MKVKILTSASQDLIDGFHFYERQSEGLGIYFLDSLFSDIESLKLYAGIHPIFFGKYYRLLSRRFPFAVYYQVEGEVISVFAVLDTRSDPKKQEKRLK